MRANALARPQPRDGQPHVRPLHQGQRHRHERDAKVPEKMRHDNPVSAHLMLLLTTATTTAATTKKVKLQKNL
jgi:hypothetical protein